MSNLKENQFAVSFEIKGKNLQISNIERIMYEKFLKKKLKEMNIKRKDVDLEILKKIKGNFGDYLALDFIVEYNYKK